MWDIIDHDLEEVYGTGRSDKVKAIVIACLSEQGCLAKGGKEDAKDRVEADEADVLGTMITSLAELRKLGLTGYEARCYVFLVKLGPSDPWKVASKASMHVRTPMRR